MKLSIAQALLVLNISGEINEETIKRAFRKLANKLHPDRNPGDASAAERMKEVNAAYSFLSKQSIEAIESTATEAHSDNLQKVIACLNQLSGIKYEQMGRWIWISGDTLPHKEALKALGCMWSRQKQLWYFRPKEHKARLNRRTHAQDELREKYGTNGLQQAKGMTAIHG